MSAKLRHFTTIFSEHQRTSAPVGEHLRGCHGNQDWTVDVLAASNNQNKLLTLEDLHIANEKPALNSRDE